MYLLLAWSCCKVLCFVFLVVAILTSPEYPYTMALYYSRIGWNCNYIKKHGCKDECLCLKHSILWFKTLKLVSLQQKTLLIFHEDVNSWGSIPLKHWVDTFIMPLKNIYPSDGFLFISQTYIGCASFHVIRLTRRKSLHSLSELKIAVIFRILNHMFYSTIWTIFIIVNYLWLD